MFKIIGNIAWLFLRISRNMAAYLNNYAQTNGKIREITLITHCKDSCGRYACRNDKWMFNQLFYALLDNSNGFSDIMYVVRCMTTNKSISSICS